MITFFRGNQINRLLFVNYLIVCSDRRYFSSSDFFFDRIAYVRKGREESLHSACQLPNCSAIVNGLHFADETTLSSCTMTLRFSGMWYRTIKYI